MIAIVDYGVGNLFSLCSSLAYISAKSIVTADEAALNDADKIILPGVGAFGDAVLKLRERGLDKIVMQQAAAGKPILGICLGMQLLYERGFEYGEHEGLGLIEGSIIPFTEETLGENFKIPHMGWNALTHKQESPLLSGINQGEYVYYVHSFYAPLNKSTAASSVYGKLEITGMAQHKNVFGVQFHPEKSGTTGLKILKNFAEMEGA